MALQGSEGIQMEEGREGEAARKTEKEGVGSSEPAWERFKSHRWTPERGLRTAKGVFPCCSRQGWNKKKEVLRD